MLGVRGKVGWTGDRTVLADSEPIGSVPKVGFDRDNDEGRVGLFHNQIIPKSMAITGPFPALSKSGLALLSLVFSAAHLGLVPTVS